MRLAVALAVVTAAATVLAGCASTVQGSAPADGPGTVTAPPPGQLVFQIDIGGGYWQQESAATARPRLSVYGDASAYVLVNRATNSRGAPLQLARALVGDLPALLTAARETGLFRSDEVDLGEPQISDSASTSVTFRPDSAPSRSVSAYALDYTRGDDDLTDRQRDGRRALRDLISTAEAAVRRDSSTTWTPDRIDVKELEIHTRTSDPQPWPGPALDTLLQPTANGSCGVVTGAAAKQVYETAVTNGNLDWSEGTTVRPLAIRALLPDEPGCQR